MIPAFKPTTTSMSYMPISTSKLSSKKALQLANHPRLTTLKLRFVSLAWTSKHNPVLCEIIEPCGFPSQWVEIQFKLQTSVFRKMTRSLELIFTHGLDYLRHFLLNYIIKCITWKDSYRLNYSYVGQNPK